METRKWVNFVVAGTYDGENVRFQKSVKAHIDDLFEYYPGATAFYHFGGKFDFLFVLQEALKHEKRFQIGAIIPRGSGILSFDLWRDGDCITFRDSSALLPFGLRKLTESFGVEHLKKEYDHSKTKGITRELLKYLEYDLKGLYEVIEKFYRWPLIEEAGGAFTLASQAIRVWRTHLPVRQIPSLSKRLDRALRPAYFGGRVEIFKPLFKDPKKRIYLYDINSLYPYCMRTFDFPTRFKHETYRWEPGSLGIYRVQVDMPRMLIPPLGTNETGKFIFPTGSFQGMWTSAELEYAQSLGARFRVERGWIFENGGPIFREFVDELYKIRLASKSEVDNTIAKLLLNSCYGKTGIRSEKENIVLDDGSLGLRPLRELKVGSETYRLMLQEVQLETFSHVAIAGFVTSYGRITDHRRIMEAPKECFYTDTDSLYTTHEYESGSGLGELKREPIWKDCPELKTGEKHRHTERCFYEHEACFLLPKTYRVGAKIRMKGFDSKKIQAFDVKDFEACLEGDLKRLRIVQEPKFATLKTAMRQGRLVTMTKQSSKQIRSHYDKRTLIKTKDGDYTTVPLELGKAQGEALPGLKTVRLKKRDSYGKCSTRNAV